MLDGPPPRIEAIHYYTIFLMNRKTHPTGTIFLSCLFLFSLSFNCCICFIFIFFFKIPTRGINCVRITDDDNGVNNNESGISIKWSNDNSNRRYVWLVFLNQCKDIEMLLLFLLFYFFNKIT